MQAGWECHILQPQQRQPGALHGAQSTSTEGLPPPTARSEPGAGRARAEGLHSPQGKPSTHPGASTSELFFCHCGPQSTGKSCFPPRFTTNLLQQQLSLLISCNYQLCDPESSLFEIFLHSSSSYSLFSIFSMARNRLSNSNSLAKSSSKKSDGGKQIGF